jgi:hypothetical protein
MGMHAESSRNGAASLYSRLEERILARDQLAAAETYYDLVRAGRPLDEIIAEAVRIHAPYTHVPYHERIDDGYPNFVNNDHCLLSARASLRLTKMMPAGLEMLPMAQTVWYIPTGLDIWNQKINKAPGHYTRSFKGVITEPPAPVVYWPDQEPLRSNAPVEQRLGDWFSLVHRGQVIDAYRTFLGLMEDAGNRNRVLAELVFAGLIDVQDRMLYNRSYTTGHKSYRARATVELGNAVGWDNAHNVLYAGALDMAVGPRWYSTYEMACNVVKTFIEGEALHAVPYGGVSDTELAMLQNTAPLTAEDETDLIDTLLHQPEPAYIERITWLLKGGTDPGGSSTRCSSPPPKSSSRRRGATISRCRCTATSIAIRSAGFTTVSTIRGGCACSMSEARSSTALPGTRSTPASWNLSRSARRRAPTSSAPRRCSIASRERSADWTDRKA